MKKQIVICFMVLGLMCSPMAASAFQFGTVDAARLFNKYSETQKTKAYLESEKAKLQVELDVKKKSLAALDEKYLATAKKIQELRDAKKEAEARNQEEQLKGLREKLVEAKTDMEKFFAESQRHLYEIEEKKMGSLSQDLDERVDRVIQQIAAQKKLEAVFEKRFCYHGGVDITDDVIAALNVGQKAPARGAQRRGGKNK